MIGHSVGPFDNPDFNGLANYVFDRTNALILRETVSSEQMGRRMSMQVSWSRAWDTASLVEHRNDIFEPDYAVQRWLNLTSQCKTVGISTSLWTNLMRWRLTKFLLPAN